MYQRGTKGDAKGLTQRGRLTMRQMTQNETTPLRHILEYLKKNRQLYKAKLMQSRE